jgi:hypothetical protein
MADASTSPIFSGVFLPAPLLALGLPFLVAGTLKAIQAVRLWLVIRRVQPIK